LKDGVFLVSATSKKGLAYFQRIRQGTGSIRLLDFRPQYAKWLSEWCSEEDIIHLQPKKSAFMRNEFVQSCEGAIIFEDDFVETALLTQALKDAGVDYIHVVRQDVKQRAVYRKLGATHVGQSIPKILKLEPGEPVAG